MQKWKLLMGVGVLAVVAWLMLYQAPRLRLAGSYQRSGEAPAGSVQQIEITRDKFILYIPVAGPRALEYSLDGDRIYVGSQPSQIIFTVDGLGIISNQGSMGIEGTYIR